MQGLVSKIPCSQPLSSVDSNGTQFCRAVWVTTLTVVVDLCLPEPVVLVQQWQHSMQKLKYPLPLVILSQVPWQSEKGFMLSMQALMSLQQHPRHRQSMYDPTIIRIIAQRGIKLSRPTNPTIRQAIKMIEKTNRTMCIELGTGTGSFLLVKLGSRTLKKLGPNPLPTPSLHVVRQSALSSSQWEF